MYTAPSFNFTISYPGNQQEHSFLDLIVTNNSLFPVGTVLDAWCLDKSINVDTTTSYTGYIYSAYEPPSISTILPNIGAHVDKLDSISWLMNFYNGSNAQYNWGEVQSAIWTMMGQDYKTELTYIQTDGDVLDADVNSLVSMALAKDGYRPGVGESMAMIVDPIAADGSHGQSLVVEVKCASLGDRVWHDVNANGLQDSGEQGIAGSKVELVRDVNGDGAFTGDEILQTTNTDSNGNYRFNGLAPGLEYQVRFTTPTGFDTFSPRQSDGSSTSGNNSDGRLSNVVVLKAGEYNDTLDAGVFKAASPNTASLGDRVWLDSNGNGQQDVGEAGVTGVTVNLYNAAGSVVSTQTTDGTGNYLFSNLAAGQYSVGFGKPNGYNFTTANAGVDSGDSDADTSTGRTGSYTLAIGEQNLTVDAGLVAVVKSCAKLLGTTSMNENSLGTYYVQLDQALDHDVTFTVQTADVTANRVDSRAQNQEIMWGGYYTNTSGKHYVNPIGGYIPLGTREGQGWVKAFGPNGNDSWDYSLFKDGGQNIAIGGTTQVTIKAGQTTSENVYTWAWNEKVHVDGNAGNSAGYYEGTEQFSLSISGSSDKNLDICKPSVTTDICDTTAYHYFSPIALDLDGNGIQTTAIGQTTGKFDLLGDGTDVTSGWLSSGDAFLAVDASGNGAIDSVKELFGGNKGNGFAKLASYDSNGDGVVNAADARFAELLVWQDLNSNHQSDAGELRSLAQAGIASLNVAYTDQEFTDAAGNVHGETSVATRADGSSIDMVDVYFNYVETSDVLDSGSLDSLIGAGTASSTSVQAEVADFGDMTMVTELLRKIADMQVTAAMPA